MPELMIIITDKCGDEYAVVPDIKEHYRDQGKPVGIVCGRCGLIVKNGMILYWCQHADCPLGLGPRGSL